MDGAFDSFSLSEDIDDSDTEHAIVRRGTDMTSSS
jgi:hypothetical protein